MSCFCFVCLRLVSCVPCFVSFSGLPFFGWLLGVLWCLFAITLTFVKILFSVITNKFRTRYITLEMWLAINTFEDTQGGIWSRESNKNRQYNDHKKNDKRTNNDLQNNAQKTQDCATRTQLKTGGELKCAGMASSFCSTISAEFISIYRNFQPTIGMHVETVILEIGFGHDIVIMVWARGHQP